MPVADNMGMGAHGAWGDVDCYFIFGGQTRPPLLGEAH